MYYSIIFLFSNSLLYFIGKKEKSEIERENNGHRQKAERE